MQEKFNFPTKIRPTLVDMVEGEIVKFPIEKLKSIRTQCSELGASMLRQYSTHIDREERTIEVTRVY